MAMTASFMQSCGMCFHDKSLRSAFVFEAARGYQNALGRRMRSNGFLLSLISNLCSRSKHKFAKKLLEEVCNHDLKVITNLSKLTNEVSALMGYNSLDDFTKNERSQKESGINPKDAMDYLGVSSACKRFPSIILGSSPVVQLYDGATPFSEYRSILAAKWVDPDNIGEAWPSLYPVVTNVNSTSFEENSPHALLLQPVSLETEVKNSNLLALTDASFTKSELKSQQNSASVDLSLDESINCILGLSKRHRLLLENSGFHTLRQLLRHYPRTYADLQNPQIGINDGHYLIFFGEILSSRGVRTSYSFGFLEVVVGCQITEGEKTSGLMIEDIDRKKTIYLHLKKFFRGTRFTSQPFLKSLQEKHKVGDSVCVSGKVRTMVKKDHYEMREYILDVLGDERNSLCAGGRPYPIYPSKGRISPSFLRDIISRALRALPVNIDPVPENITEDFGLLCLHGAYVGIHQPKDLNEADLARKRLIFDEFFYLQLGRLYEMLKALGTRLEKEGLLDKYRKPELNTVFVEDWSSLAKKFLKALPYSLTSSQLTAASEIIWDLKRPVPMNRLLQGDVGCGKTVVAFLACMEVIGSGYQAAFMVPTELLAVQHYEQVLSLLENMEEVENKPSVALLTGSTPSKQSRIILKGLLTGDISFVIGTHSLIAEHVEFLALRIAVVDEQHRFGVIQRGTFNSKLYWNTSSRTEIVNLDSSSKVDGYMAPHVLALSATPIPRTLALALYGDMSLTQITDLPPGRIAVETFIFEGNEAGFEKVYKMMWEDLGADGKVFLVYPVIEQSEQLPQLRAAASDFETISSRFLDYSCGLLHGKMKGDEKTEALRKFKCGETHILLSTQVIEIGVDVPDASMMVVMNAERFGIAQLHQLRGRVGRGARSSKCILVASTASSLNRLKVLQNSSDGFYLANIDLLLRGPGDLLGKKQSGHIPEFPIARLEIDGNVLQDAHQAALKVLGASHDLEQFPRLKTELSMRQPLCLLGD